MDIKAIVFDLGGVFVELDYSKFYNDIIVLSPLEKPQTPIMMEFFRQSDLYHQGKMSEDEFYNLACSLLQVCLLEKKDFYRAFNSIISGTNEKMIKLLQDIKSRNKYKLIALSNVNASHWEYILNKNWEFIEFFDELILSHEIHMTKPDPEVYDLTIEKANCEPEEILFVDDGLNNVKAAEQKGINAIHFETPKSLVEDFKKLKILPEDYSLE